MAKAATFGPQTARDIIAVVQYLQRNGFAITPPGRGDNRIPEADYVFVRNDTGEEIPPYACLQVTGSVEYNGQNWLTVEKPADTDGTAGWFVFNGINTIGTSSAERYGTAHDGPHVRMLTDGSTVTAGNRWRPTVGAFTIEPGDGPFIAGGDDDIKPDVMKGFIASTGGNPVRHAMTKEGGINSRSGLTMGSATCDLYVSSGAGVLSDSGTDVTVYNPFSQAVAGLVHILIELNEAGLWVVIAEDCG